jgi:hypothetical protein
VSVIGGPANQDRRRYSRLIAGAPKAIVVSFAGGNPFSPRAQRTARVAQSLEHDFGYRVERVPTPVPGKDGLRGPLKHTPPRRVVRRALNALLLDEFELAARGRLRGWKPSARGALLIGYPYSPLYLAAVRLVAAGVPYTVDVGDPWVVTANPGDWGQVWGRFRGRARAAETFLWENAAAGVVTSVTQASRLRSSFPNLDLLRRPNGYEAVDTTVRGTESRRAPGDELRLVQFGSVYEVRLPIGPWLSRLRRAAGCKAVLFANYGYVNRPELLQSTDPAVIMESHDPVEWPRACEIAQGFDAAVVIGNQNPAQLPSKAVQYLTLPIPRIAVTPGPHSDLAAFAAERPGFIAVDIDSAEDIARALAHLRRAWSSELTPPPGDSWDAVAGEIAGFAIEAWAAGHPQTTLNPSSPAPPG